MEEFVFVTSAFVHFIWAISFHAPAVVSHHTFFPSALGSVLPWSLGLGGIVLLVHHSQLPGCQGTDQGGCSKNEAWCSCCTRDHEKRGAFCSQVHSSSPVDFVSNEVLKDCHKG